LYDTLGKYLVGSAYYFHFTIRGVF